MNYFAITFPNHHVFFVSVPENYKAYDVCARLLMAGGFIGRSGIVYNPNQFISVESVSSVAEGSARSLKEVLL